MTLPIAIRQSILVAGGRSSGVKAALGAAEAGREVVPAERDAPLGEGTARLCRAFSGVRPPDLRLGDKQAGLDGRLIPPPKLIEIAHRKYR
jgi:heterodisulfide reductase subunit A-like polyferredoxin